MLCALTHALLGVHHDDLMADFLRTNDPERISRGVHRLRGWLHQMTGRIIDDSALVTALRVEPEYLDAFFSSIARRYGTVRRYCEEHLSLPASSVERLSRRLIQSEPESSKRKTPQAKDGSTLW
jgi:protein tyrosine/serine phosphatase